MADYCLSYFTLSDFDLAGLTDSEFETLPDFCTWEQTLAEAGWVLAVGPETAGVLAVGPEFAFVLAKGPEFGNVFARGPDYIDVIARGPELAGVI